MEVFNIILSKKNSTKDKVEGNDVMTSATSITSTILHKIEE